MFIFSFLLMLFCVLWYVVGIHLHIICRDLKDGKLIDDFNIDLKYNSERIYIGGTIQKCRDNMALYEAIGGEKYYNISSEFDVKKVSSFLYLFLLCYFNR